MKTCVLVLGCHRSGTSMLAGMLNKLDVYMGNNLKEPDKNNNKGFYEQVDILHLNERILNSVGCNWRSGKIPSNAVDGYEQDISNVIDYNFSNSSLFAIKDPKISRLLPLWKSVLNDKGIKIIYFVIERNSNNVCKSMERFRGIPKDKSLKIQKFYKRDITKYTENPYYFKYEEILRWLKREIGRVCDILNLPLKDVSGFLK